MNDTIRSNKHYQNMISSMFERMKQTYMKEQNTTINFIQCKVQLYTKYCDDDYRHRIRRLVDLYSKTDIVDYELRHLHSLKKMIAPNYINNLYLVNLETRLIEIISSGSRWIK